MGINFFGWGAELGDPFVWAYAWPIFIYAVPATSALLGRYAHR